MRNLISMTVFLLTLTSCSNKEFCETLRGARAFGEFRPIDVNHLDLFVLLDINAQRLRNKMLKILNLLFDPRTYIKAYIKSIPKNKRFCRIIFLGKRGKIRQYRLLHFTTHPFEHNKEDKS